MSQVFEIIVFTASRQDYADAVIDKLDPSGTLVDHRLYRNHCLPVYDFFVKDLRVLSNRKLEDLIIVDNLIYSFANHMENGIPILPYIKGKEDRELFTLEQHLAGIKSFIDCREWIEQKFHLKRFYETI